MCNYCLCSYNTSNKSMRNDDKYPDTLKRSMVRLADTVRTIHVIGYRIRNGLSTNQFPDPVLRDYDIIGSTVRSDND